LLDKNLLLQVFLSDPDPDPGRLRNIADPQHCQRLPNILCQMLQRAVNTRWQINRGWLLAACTGLSHLHVTGNLSTILLKNNKKNRWVKKNYHPRFTFNYALSFQAKCSPYQSRETHPLNGKTAN
jgi:hypothetical protein